MKTLLRHTLLRKSAAVACSLLLVSAFAYGGTTSQNMSVTASVSNNCTLSTPTFAFGSYDPIGTNASTPLDATADLTVTCTQGASTTITMDQGSNADTGSTAASPLRRLKTGSEYLSYNLYTDSGRTTVWNGTTGASYTGTGSSTSVTVYGRISSGQTSANAGSYSDTVAVTITF